MNLLYLVSHTRYIPRFSQFCLLVIFDSELNFKKFCAFSALPGQKYEPGSLFDTKIHESLRVGDWVIWGLQIKVTNHVLTRITMLLFFCFWMKYGDCAKESMLSGTHCGGHWITIKIEIWLIPVQDVPFYTSHIIWVN